MKTLSVRIIGVALALLALWQIGMSQESLKPTLRVVSSEMISPKRTEVGVVKYRLTFEFLNGTVSTLRVYGQKNRKKFIPLFYLLSRDANLDKWNFPTSNGLPVPWEKESPLNKSSISLRPAENFRFDVLVSERQGKMRFAIAVCYGEPDNLPSFVHSEGIDSLEK